MRALVTGCAGFIGSHLTESLLEDGHEVLGVDCFNDNYARSQKLANLRVALDFESFRFARCDLASAEVAGLLAGCDAVFHLAAEPGVRSSWGSRFEVYLRNNVAATQRLLYHANHGVEAVALRYFSVYGPRQRPDMAFNRFCRAALADEPITLFGDGRQTRDFTYVADVVAATRAAALSAAAPGRV